MRSYEIENKTHYLKESAIKIKWKNIPNYSTYYVYIY